MIYRLPPLNALRVFEAAARHLSFKEAANELSITQAAVSHQIKSLEDYLGVQLFKRAGRGVSSSKMVDAGALDQPAVTTVFDLRNESSGVEIHLGAGDYPGYRADKLFGVSTIVVASPELVKGKPGLRAPVDLASHTLLH